VNRGGRIRETAGVGVSALGLAVVLLLTLAAGGVDSGREALHPRRTVHGQDIHVTASDFRNLQTMTHVRGFFMANPLGHLRQALKVANSKRGGTYPVGTIIQLVPQEAMVKRRKGFDPATHDWEFFTLAVSPQGTQILTRGTTAVVNRFGGSCESCHVAAKSRFDFVCEHNHGCAPLPVGDDIIVAVQRADPRPLTPTG
jgi:hypothetical protein